jgi:hypothetical protein
LTAHSSLAQRRRACLVFFDETALSLTPNVRRTWAPRGHPPVLVHPFNWKKASMVANLTGPTLAEVIAQAHLGIERVRQTPHLADSFLRHTGLSVS